MNIKSKEFKSFEKYFSENPQVWKSFKLYTFQMIKSGRTKYSAWAVINRIRRETDIKTTGKEFKISNNHIAYYARLFMFKYPEYGDFFNVKKMKDE